MHDAYRVDKGGKPTFDRVMRGLDVLKRHGVDWNVLTTVHAINGDHGGQVYRFLRDDLGATFIQYIPIIERATPETLAIADAGWGSGVRGRPLYIQDGSLITHRSVRPEQYGRFMVDVFEEWVRHDIGTVYVQMFDTALANFYGEPAGMCVHAETCGQQLAIEHNGDLYSCDHFVEPGYLLGNIADRTMLELVASPQQLKFGQDKRDSLTKFCLDCDVRVACNGGCPKDRFATSPYGEPGQHYLCPGYKQFFGHVREPMDESWKKSSVVSGRAISSEVSLTMAIVSLPVGGTITRMAWGSTIRSMDLPLLMPRASAASAWPLSTERIPARAISDI